MVLNGYALQRPGTNKEMLSLMHQMAQDSKLPPAGYCGTILFDVFDYSGQQQGVQIS